MTSRERILSTLKKARVPNDMLPPVVEPVVYSDVEQQLTNVLQSIGGAVIGVNSLEQIAIYLNERFVPAGRWISLVDGLDVASMPLNVDPHEFENVQLVIFEADFAVAENGAVWITGDRMGDRALPFICEHIALIIERANIVQSMRHAYERIGRSDHDFGTFIAGPSKTADIEQSLVLGAHGPKSMTLFIKS